jgi:hypothetical protein
MSRNSEKEKMKIGAQERATRSPARRSVFSPALLVCLLIFLALPLSISGAVTLTEYRQKVQKTKNLAEILLNVDEQNLSPAEISAYTQKNLAALRQNLPASEKIEWPGTSIETDNRWLHDKLDSYEKQNDAARRKNILREIVEQLAAVEQNIDRLERSTAADRSKDEDKRKLREILGREEYQKPPPEEKSLIRRILDAIGRWFSREVPRPDIPATPADLGSLSVFLQILLYVVIFGVLGFVFYRFAPFLATRFKKREKAEKKERVILGERIGADESADNIFSDAERLAREGNMRGAIRKGYIALLCELSDRKVIGLSRHKTNRDYLRDVRKRRELYENMNGLTSNFERHWYGLEDAGEKDWEEFRSGYQKAVAAKY